MYHRIVDMVCRYFIISLVNYFWLWLWLRWNIIITINGFENHSTLYVCMYVIIIVHSMERRNIKIAVILILNFFINIHPFVPLPRSPLARELFVHYKSLFISWFQFKVEFFYFYFILLISCILFCFYTYDSTNRTTRNRLYFILQWSEL